jgi:hypothetical protein
MLVINKNELGRLLCANCGTMTTYLPPCDETVSYVTRLFGPGLSMQNPFYFDYFPKKFITRNVYI